ncbi:MAG: hypothetical protein HN750_21460 [Gemmatimonadales bacterium]|jgi:type I restriction enzyme, S subunit|nr:hypothetical protein [Gemmatimonadales bacterium]
MSESVPLRACVSSYIGGGWGEEQAFEEFGVPAFVIRGTDFESCRAGNPSKVPYRFHKSSNAEKRLLNPGDICLEGAGGSDDQPVGRVLLIDDYLLAKLSGPVICASFCKLLRPNLNQVNPTYLFWVLQAAYQCGSVEKYQVQSTGIRNFQLEYFLDDFQVPLPAIAVQQSIGALLTRFENLYRNNRRRIELLEETARLLYREWFVNFRYPGHEDVPLVDSELGRVPQGWKCSKIMDVAAIDYGDQLPKNQMGIGVIPVYGAAKQIGRHDKANTLEPTLIMGCRGSCGEVSITDSPAFVTNNSFLIKPKLCDRRQWLFLLLQDRGVGEFITGSAQPQITLANLAYLKIKEPPPELLDEFHRITSPLFELILNFHQQQIKIEEVRDLLLPRLVSGDLDISDLELDLEAVN